MYPLQRNQENTYTLISVSETTRRGMNPTT